jgi:hypothetical protein
MKGTVHGPQKPVPGATASNAQAAGKQEQQGPVNRANRITRAVWTTEHAAAEGSRGYDPYNTAVSRPADTWKRKP